MHARHLALLAGTVALAYACGSRTHAFSMATAVAATTGESAVTRPRMAHTTYGTALTSTMDVAVTDDEVRFVLHVTNTTSKKLELTFPSGQTHDIVVIDAAGGELWRWSSGQMFTQALRNQPLKPHASISYAVRWRRPRAHGPLTAVASLTSSNYPVESRAEFQLP